MTLFLLIVGLPGGLCVALVHDGYDRHAFAFATIFALPCCLVLAAFLRFFCSTSFSADGVYGQSVWGFPRFVPWRDIVDVRLFRLLNLQWLRIHAADKTVTWLVLFPSRRHEFQQEIQKFAPKGCTVLNYLR